MKVGQILRTASSIRIKNTDGKGRVTDINLSKGWIDIGWQRRDNNNKLYYDAALRYDLLHIAKLLDEEKLSIYNELSERDPNLLFKAKGLKK